MHGMGKMCGMCGCDMNAKGHGMMCGCMMLGKLLFALGLIASIIALTLAVRDSLLAGYDSMFWYFNGIVLLLLSTSCKACSKSMKMRMMGCGGCGQAGCASCGGKMGGCCNEGGKMGGDACCQDEMKK